MSKKAKKHAANKKTIIRIALIVGVILIAVGIGVAVQLIQKNTSTQNNPDADPFTIAGGPPLPKVVNEAQDLAVDGNINESNKKIDEALNNNPNESTKLELYVQQGLNEMNQGKFAEAIIQLRKAEAIKSEFKVVNLIAQAAEASGDKVLAIEYYKKAIPLINPESPIKDDEKRRIEDKIKALGGQV